MAKSTAFILIILAFVAGVAAGALGLLYVTGGNAEPSRDVQSVVPTLAVNDNDTDDAPADTDTDTTEDSDANTEADTTDNTDASASDDETLYRINAEQSEARFIIDEVLFGNPKTVVGVTSDVAGDLIVNFSDPSASTVGQIAVSARTLTTDNNQRNQALRGRILQSSTDEFEFITFVPTAINGLPAEPVAEGESIEFEIVGDLTVRGTTNEVTFNTTLTLQPDNTLNGLAVTTILYPDFGITVQAPPSVSNISEEVILELEFTAVEVDE